MRQEFEGKEVSCIVYEEDSEDSLTIYWKDGKKTKCMLVEEL